MIYLERSNLLYQPLDPTNGVRQSALRWWGSLFLYATDGAFCEIRVSSKSLFLSRLVIYLYRIVLFLSYKADYPSIGLGKDLL